VPAHYTGYKPGVLDIFFEYSLKIPRICLNILKYTRYFLVGQAWRSYGQGGQASGWAHKNVCMKREKSIISKMTSIASKVSGIANGNNVR
jgi:hypothetical protein